MATWRLETLDKKSVYEREFWKKDGIRVEVVTGYRWGSVLIESDDIPDIDLNLDESDEYGLDVTVLDDCQIDTIDDVCFEDFITPDDMEEETVKQLTELCYSGELESNGWDLEDTEIMFYGPLSLTEVID